MGLFDGGTYNPQQQNAGAPKPATPGIQPPSWQNALNSGYGANPAPIDWSKIPGYTGGSPKGAMPGNADGSPITSEQFNAFYGEPQNSMAYQALASTPQTDMTPQMNPYSAITDRSGQLKQQFQMAPATIGDSTSWRNAAMGMNNAQTQNLVDSTNQQAYTQGSQAQDQLAMNGGLSSGARERIASDAGRNAMFAGQDARNQGNLNNLNIGTQGAQMDMDANKYNAGASNQANQFNIQNLVGNNQGQNAYNLTNYQERMKDFTGTKLANAMAQANGQGGGMDIGGMTGGLTNPINSNLSSWGNQFNSNVSGTLNNFNPGSWRL